MSFSMAAQDQGAEAALGTALHTLNELNDSIENQQKISKKGSFITKFKDQIRDFNIASIASKMGDLTGTTNNLTTSLENFGMQAAQTARPILVQAGVTGKALDQMTGKITGMAYGMELDAGTIAQSFAAVETSSSKAKSAINHLGLSMADLVKLSHATGQSTEDLVKVVGNLSSQWGLSDDQVKTLLNDMASLGRQAGIGAEAYLGLGSSMEVVNETLSASMLPKTPEMIMKINTSIARLAGAFKEGLGTTPKKAMETAQKSFGIFAEEVAKTNEQLKIGLESNFGPMTLAMNELFGNVQISEKEMAKGMKDPLALVTDMSDAMGEMAKHKTFEEQAAFVARFRARLAAANPDLAYLVFDTQKGNKALHDMAGIAPVVGNELKKMGQEGFRTTIGLQKQLDMTKEVFENKLMSISKDDVKNFVQEQRAAYREVGDNLIKLGSDKTWGPLVHAFSAFKRGGITAGLQSLGKQLGIDTRGMGKFAAKVQIGLDIMHSMGEALGPVMSLLGQFGPLGMLAGGIAGFFMLSAEDRAKIWKKIDPIWQKIKKVWKDDIEPAIEKVFKADIFPLIQGGLSSLWKYLTTPDPQTKKSIMTGVGEAVLTGLRWAWDRVADLISSDKIAIAGAVIMAFKAASMAGTLATTLASVVASAVRGGASSGFGALGGAGMALGPMGAVALMLTELAAGFGLAMIAAMKDANKTDEERAAEQRKLHKPESVKRVKELTDFSSDIVSKSEEKSFVKGSAEEFTATMSEYGVAKQTKLAEGFKNISAKTIDDIKYSEDMMGQIATTLRLSQKQIDDVKDWAAKRGKELHVVMGTAVETDMTLNKDVQTFLDNLQKLQVSQTEQSVLETLGKALEDKSLKGRQLSYTGGQLTEWVKNISEMSPADVAILQAGGVEMIQVIRDGMTMGAPQVKDAMQSVWKDQLIPSIPAHSPAEEGPLSGKTLSNAGLGLLDEILVGIKDGQKTFEEGFADVLKNSLVYAMTAFRSDIVTQVDQTLHIMDTELQKVLGADVYKQMVLKVGPAPEEATKNVAEAAFGDTGVTGIKMAILTQTNELTKVLNKIETNTRPAGVGPGKGGRKGADANAS